MVTFDAAQPGTTVARWVADPRLTALTDLDMTSVTALLVVAAHPDDETLGAGGLIAHTYQRGIPTTVIVATDGADGHHNTATPITQVDPASMLPARRMAETRAAVALLNRSASVVFLNLPDGQTGEHRGQLATLLRPHLAASPPGAMAVIPWRGDGHRDHRVVGEIAAQLAAEERVDVIEYPIWMWHWATPDSPEVPWPQMVAVALTESLRERKRQAIDAFVSQVQPSDAGPALLRPDFLDHFRQAREVFIDSRIGSLSAPYFDDLYAARADPWRLATRWYETRKRAITVASLPRARYRRAVEIGCSIGMLTRELASRCDTLLAVDVAAAALASARERLRDDAHVTFAQLDVTTGFPAGFFDLIVLSEVGYYLSRTALISLVERAERHLEAGGILLLCHWRHPVDDYLLSGDQVHQIANDCTTLTRIARHDEKDFILEIYSSNPSSVAQDEGLAP
ncbi:bifunctional PIG-L family deacetylase/class I SAM-dependent methyltransferase [Salinibacterium sp.]|uniref:bifunctional PIG-L family deacetylase/class I SAM-dependent methyltransferase n=1 Tax=Salinibacterium sp. TaxID=1915057 RepID=UPI00286D3193|nr:bifunctional PIG-L family deacetylase/class I SAM-dependent methyltransferase [Salinibacterium sp.]